MPLVILFIFFLFLLLPLSLLSMFQSIIMKLFFINKAVLSSGWVRALIQPPDLFHHVFQKSGEEDESQLRKASVDLCSASDKLADAGPERKVSGGFPSLQAFISLLYTQVSSRVTTFTHTPRSPIHSGTLHPSVPSGGDVYAAAAHTHTPRCREEALYHHYPLL